jgi:hypothetical protein
MRTKTGIVVLLCVFGLFGYGCYRKGSLDAASKAAAEYKAEHQNDSNGDLSVKHSASYSLGYARGRGDGYAETRQKDFFECGEKLAQLAVETGNTKVAAKWVVNGYIAPSQLETAASQYKQKQSGESH